LKQIIYKYNLKHKSINNIKIFIVLRPNYVIVLRPNYVMKYYCYKNDNISKYSCVKISGNLYSKKYYDQLYEPTVSRRIIITDLIPNKFHKYIASLLFFITDKKK